MAKDNQAHIYIYGIIDGYQDNNPGEWGCVNLKDVKNQLDKQKNYNEIVVHIHSEGGHVTEGFAIYAYLKEQKAKVITKIDGVCASIATVILLAGEERIGSEHSTPLIHNPFGMVGGESKDMKKYAKELEVIEDQISDLYATKTNLTKEEALEYMRVETTFTADEALANGFLTKIDAVMRAVALFNTNKSKTTKKRKMAKSETKQKKKEVESIINKVLKNLGINSKKNKVITDANGGEIDFYELEDGATPTVGDKAKIDGKEASGDVVMPSGETYVFSDGALSEIKPEEEEVSEEVEDLKEEVATLNKKYKALKKAHAILKAEDEAKANKLKSIKKDMKKLKKNLSGSNFSYNPKKKNFKPKENGTRSVFKPEEK